MADPAWRADLRRLGLALLIAGLHGLIYVFLLPPWQHYDEPNHFERAWLEAGLTFSQPGDFAARMNRQVYRSMIETGFFDYTGGKPVLPLPREKVRIPGFSQSDEPPLYYRLAGLAVRLMPQASVKRQLYAMRLVSWLLYLLTVVAAWGVGRELFSERSPARRLLPLTAALLPGLAELMSAANNDVLAAAVFSWFFWGALRLLQRGPRPLELAWVCATAALAYYTKNTALIALPLLALALPLSVLRGRARRAAIALLLLAPLLVLAGGATLDDARAWLRGVDQADGLRISTTTPGLAAAGLHPAVGQAALQLNAGGEQTSRRAAPPVYQVLPPATAAGLFGRPVTLGAWMWASEALPARTPQLLAGGQKFSKTVALTTQPQFFAFQAVLPRGQDRIWLTLDPDPPPGRQARVYYDAIVLAAGQYPEDQPPVFVGPDAAGGAWGGQPFQNLVRNASVEQPALRLRGRLDLLSERFLPDRSRATTLLASLQDLGGTGYFYLTTLRHLFHTFWARFAWGHVPLAGSWSYLLPAAASLLGLVGLAWGLLRRRGRLDGAVLLLCLSACLVTWAIAAVRGMVYLHLPGYYFSTARHAVPVIVPTLAALVFGWSELYLAAARLAQFRRPTPVDPAGAVPAQAAPAAARLTASRLALALYLAFFLWLIAWSILSIAWHYRLL
ncbi:MAG: hypothetical protein ACKOC5_03725 [Chloroflexota bacterium]